MVIILHLSSHLIFIIAQFKDTIVILILDDETEAESG